MMEKRRSHNCSLLLPTNRITGREAETAPKRNRGLLLAEEGAGRNNCSTAPAIIIHGLGGESVFYIFSWRIIFSLGLNFHFY